MLVLAGCTSQPRPPAQFSFALFGDTPYSYAQVNQLDALIAQMNREPLAFAAHVGDITAGATAVGGNIHVIYLKNAVAVKVAEVLRAVYSGDAGGSSAAARPAAAPILQGAPQAPAPATATAAGIIQADAATNAIIITAPDAIYNSLRAAVDKLDVRRAQVYVEALIAEVTADKAAEFGIQWQSLTGLTKSGTQGFGGTNFGGTGQNILGVAQNPGSVGHGLNVGILY